MFDVLEPPRPLVEHAWDDARTALGWGPKVFSASELLAKGVGPRPMLRCTDPTDRDLCTRRSCRSRGWRFLYSLARGVSHGGPVRRMCVQELSGSSRSRSSRSDGFHRVDSVHRGCVVRGLTRPIGVYITSRVRRTEGRSRSASVFLGLSRWRVWIRGTPSLERSAVWS